MRISDWSSDVCSSDLADKTGCGQSAEIAPIKAVGRRVQQEQFVCPNAVTALPAWQTPTPSVVRFGYGDTVAVHRSEEHTSELQSLMSSSYAVFCLKKKQSTAKLAKEYISIRSTT